MDIIETKERKVLNEGRNNGMAFAFLKRTVKAYLSVQPFSPCKDYLNEVIFTENTGIGCQGCGLKYLEPQNIFKNCLYLGIKIVKSMDGGYSYSMNIDNDIAHLKNNYKNIELTP